MNSRPLRTLVLRLLGLLVCALAALGAVGLVAFAVAGAQSPTIDGAESFSSWASGSLLDWAYVLVGVGLFLLAAVFVVIMLRRRPSGLLAMRTDRSGRSMLDLSSVAHAVQTSIRESVDPKITVGARRGRLTVVTPFAPSQPYDLVDRAGTSVKEQLEKLGLEGHVRYEVTAGNETKRRVQ